MITLSFTLFISVLLFVISTSNAGPVASIISGPSGVVTGSGSTGVVTGYGSGGVIHGSGTTGIVIGHVPIPVGLGGYRTYGSGLQYITNYAAPPVYGYGAAGWGYGGVAPNVVSYVGHQPHAVVVKGPQTVPVVISGPSGKIVADGLYGVPAHGAYW